MSDATQQPPAHDEYADDLAAYALGALGDDEAARLRVHLETCERCRDHLRWLAPAVDLLPHTVEQLTPPPDLRKSMMAAVRAEAPVTTGDRPRHQRRSRWRGWSGLILRPATAAVAGVMLVVGAVAGYLLHEPTGGESTSMLAVHAAATAPRASGVLERQDGSGILRVQGMPTLARDQVYEVWVQRDGTLQPSSLFVLRRNHSGDAAVPGPLDNADDVLVTKEPRGGTSQPTSAPLLRVELQ